MPYIIIAVNTKPVKFEYPAMGPAPQMDTTDIMNLINGLQTQVNEINIILSNLQSQSLSVLWQSVISANSALPGTDKVFLPQPSDCIAGLTNWILTSARGNLINIISESEFELRHWTSFGPLHPLTVDGIGQWYQSLWDSVVALNQSFGQSSVFPVSVTETHPTPTHLNGWTIAASSELNMLPNWNIQAINVVMPNSVGWLNAPSDPLPTLFFNITAGNSSSGYFIPFKFIISTGTGSHISTFPTNPSSVKIFLDGVDCTSCYTRTSDSGNAINGNDIVFMCNFTRRINALQQQISVQFTKTSIDDLIWINNIQIMCANSAGITGFANAFP